MLATNIRIMKKIILKFLFSLKLKPGQQRLEEDWTLITDDPNRDIPKIVNKENFLKFFTIFYDNSGNRLLICYRNTFIIIHQSIKLKSTFFIAYKKYALLLFISSNAIHISDTSDS